jgi:predicted RNase H-like HicB family nuclease
MRSGAELNKAASGRGSMTCQFDLCPSDIQAGNWSSRRLVGVRGDHHNFKHPASRFIITIVHPEKGVPVGRAVDTVKKIRLQVLEQTEAGFAVQAPDLAIVTSGETIEAATRAAGEAIRSNLEAYREAGQPVPEAQSASSHLENPEFHDLLFAYVDVAEPQGRIAA